MALHVGYEHKLLQNKVIETSLSFNSILSLSNSYSNTLNRQCKLVTAVAFL